jgi:hypothetical protein
MPPKDSSGFCYWPFADDHGATPYQLNSSSIIVPKSCEDRLEDIPFSRAILRLMLGQIGILTVAPVAGEFGWNRIVHDVIKRAMKETLRCSAGIADVKDLSRTYDGAAEMLAMLASCPALVANPFEEMSEAFGSESLRQLSAELSETSRLSLEGFERIFHYGGGDEPPKQRMEHDDSPDDSGGAAFLQIHIGEEATDNARRKRLRNIEL